MSACPDPLVGHTISKEFRTKMIDWISHFISFQGGDSNLLLSIVTSLGERGVETGN
jgi:hypothetical protein